MKKILFLMFFICAGSLFVYAQSNYVQGYIITNGQDTVNGWLDYRTDKMNGQICRFKTDLSAKEQSFKPDEIAGFRFLNTGKFYITKAITIDSVPRVVFLEYLIKGIMNLYFYQDNSFNILGYYVFEDENGDILTIAKHVDEMISDDHGLNLHKDNRYKNILIYKFGNIQTISEKIPKAEFAHNSMIDIAKEYHNQLCTTGEECISFETKVDKKPIKFKFSAYAGYEVKSYKEYYYPNKKHAANAFVIGGRVEFYMPRWNKSLSVLLDLSYTKNRGTIEEYNLYYKKSSISQFRLDYGFKYTYHKGIIRPTIEAGVSLQMETYPSPTGIGVELWGGFAGIGMDFKIAKEKYVFLLADFTNSNIFFSGTGLVRFKLGYKF